MIDQVIAAAVASGGLTAGVVVLVLHMWLSERLKRSIGAEYDRQLEKHRRELELRFSDQVRLRKVYEDLSMSLEDVFGGVKGQAQDEISIVFHKMFALLALYAPDDVYKDVRDTFYSKGTKTVYARDFRPVVYHAIRKFLLGEETQLTATDIVDNLEMKPLAESR